MLIKATEREQKIHVSFYHGKVEILDIIFVLIVRNLSLPQSLKQNLEL